MVVLTTPSSLSQAVKVVKTNKRGDQMKILKKIKLKHFYFLDVKEF